MVLTHQFSLHFTLSENRYHHMSEGCEVTQNRQKIVITISQKSINRQVLLKNLEYYWKEKNGINRKLL
jgi:hypothetical protein